MSELDTMLHAELTLAQGDRCFIPRCTAMWVDKAHIEPSGMGGRPSTYTVDNLVGLCRPHHDVFDGRELAGRQRMLRDLMTELKRLRRLERGELRVRPYTGP